MRTLIAASLALVLSAGLALAQSPPKVEGTVKMVDPQRGKMLVALPFDGGIKIVEYDLGKDVKFLDEKGNPLKNGLKNDIFKSPNNRPAIPISLSFGKDGGVKGVRLTPPPK